MLLRPGAMVAVVTVTLTVAADALAADQTITARTSPDRWDTPNVTIDVGDTVTFTNAAGTHNVKFADGLFEMPLTGGRPALDVRSDVHRRRRLRLPLRGALEHDRHRDGASRPRPGPAATRRAGGPGRGDPPPGGPGPGPGDPTPGLTPLRVTFKAERRGPP